MYIHEPSISQARRVMVVVRQPVSAAASRRRGGEPEGCKLAYVADLCNARCSDERPL